MQPVQSTQPAQPEVVYLSSAYYGVFFPNGLAEVVLDIIRTDSRWKEIAGKKREIRVGKTVLSWSINSDVAEGASVVFVFADNLTYEGPEQKDPQFNFINLDPTAMLNKERSYPTAMSLMSEFYTFIIQEFKKRKLSYKEVYYGWKVISCAWFDNSESSEESSSDEVAETVVTEKKSPISSITSSLGNISSSSEIKKRATKQKK